MPTPLSPIAGDLDGDRRADLVGGRRVELSDPPTGGELVRRLGNGDRTFGSEEVIATRPWRAPIGAGRLQRRRSSELPQRRPAAGGTSVHTAGPGAAPPGFLRLVREGTAVMAYYKAEPAC